jgi:hypothetical protein
MDRPTVVGRNAGRTLTDVGMDRPSVVTDSDREMASGDGVECMWAYHQEMISLDELDYCLKRVRPRKLNDRPTVVGNNRGGQFSGVGGDRPTVVSDNTYPEVTQLPNIGSGPASYDPRRRGPR